MADRSAEPDADSASRLIADLNPSQREAALALVGPVRILAGPGTGKTRTITHRIAYGVRSGVYDPDRVLALTFTNRAAGELRGRLAALKVPTVQARTFHAAALRQLTYFWPHVVGGEPPRVVASKSRFVAEAAERVGTRLDPVGVRAVAETIEWRKTAELRLDDYAARLERGEMQPPARLSANQAIDLHDAYEVIKDERRIIDFEDVLLATAGMLETETWITQQVREQYRFLVVDEYQDVSPLQHKLLRLWLGNRRELCVVGDPAQTIFSFTGASSSFLIDFDREYPDARTVRLDENYRSSVPILGVANALAARIQGAISLVAAETASEDAPARRPAVPDLDEFADEMVEARAIARRAAQAVAAGESAAEIAVLVRTNAQTAAIERALQDAGVPYRIAGGRPFFQRPEVRAAVAGCNAAVIAGHGDRPLFQAVSDVLRDRGYSVEPPAEPGELLDAWRSLDAIMRLAEATPPGTSLAEFSAELTLRAKLQHEPALDAVTVATMHSAKGLEWDRVFVAGLSEGRVPIVQAVSEPQLDEERRLLYVAITRARRELHLSWSRAGWRDSAEAAPSRFLAELGNRIRRGIHTAPAAARQNP
ncbi:ATP-dependent helicase [Gulosibacter macacae]|uniref:DNA 3'-5' helicase n=1 Tax=Gulosibacter macacae TaxID=2488791 RepID=A0A3P3W3V8_9MICO|nr:ATP-dependent helicase [Gulosibacter macacae]RRJ88606.1 ATP-dependent helicase [Gulosibacter macacae]